MILCIGVDPKKILTKFPFAHKIEASQISVLHDTQPKKQETKIIKYAIFSQSGESVTHCVCALLSIRRANYLMVNY